MRTFAPDFHEIKQKVDPLAQSVEHNTFNVGVLGSSPKRITKKRSSLTSFLFPLDVLTLRCIWQWFPDTWHC